MRRTNFYFSDELLERVRAYAESTGQTSSDVIRLAIDEYLLRRKSGGHPAMKLHDAVQAIQASINHLAEELKREAEKSRPVRHIVYKAVDAVSAELKATPGPPLKALKKPRKKRGES